VIKRDTPNNKKYYLIFTIIFLTVIVLLSRSLPDLLKKYKRNVEKRNAVEKSYNNLLDKKNDLAERVEFRKTERGIESEIRNRFNVAKEGEKVIVLVEEKDVIENNINNQGENLGTRRTKINIEISDDRSFFQKISDKFWALF
jgi:cell division protein FtsB